jgi:hypothetical protein
MTSITNGTSKNVTPCFNCHSINITRIPDFDYHCTLKEVANCVCENCGASWLEDAQPDDREDE